MAPIRFGIIGEYQSGKSLLTNCLLRRSIATVGKGAPTTHTVVNYRYGEEEYVRLLTNKNKSKTISIDEFRGLDTSTDIRVADVYVKNDFLKDFILTDIPGYGANNADNMLATEVLSEIDFAILIASSEKSFGAGTDSFRSLYALKENHIPYYSLLNCTKTDRWRCDDDGNIKIAVENTNLLAFYPPSKFPLRDDGLNIVNLMWYWYSICGNDDELINRRTNKQAFSDYGIEPSMKDLLREVCGFDLIQKIFSMENRGFLEIKQSIRDEINALKKELCPVGTIQAFATNRIPSGWMICDGRALSVMEYPELFAAIGSFFGTKDKGSFMIPDLKGRFIRGWDKTGEIDIDRKFGSIQEDSIQEHSHNLKVEGNISDAGSHSHSLYYQKNTIHYGQNTFSSDYEALLVRTPVSWSKYYDEKYGKYNWSKDDYIDHTLGSGGSHSHTLPKITVEEVSDGNIRVSEETRPKNVALLFCIKAK